MTCLPEYMVRCEACRNYNTKTCYNCINEQGYYCFYEYSAVRNEAWKNRQKEKQKEEPKPKGKLNTWKVIELLQRE